MNPQSNYDFIMNPAQAPKRSMGAGPVQGKRMLMLAGAVVVLFLLFFVALAFKGGGGAAANLTGIAETQTEVIRVAAEGVSGGGVTATANQNLSVNVQLVVTSQLNALKKLLTSQGTKLSDKTLNLKKNTSTDAQLTTAQQNSTYDVVFAQVMQTELSNYLSELKSAYQADTGTKTRALLSTDYTQAAMLYSQVPSAASLGGS
ncbi:MAG TPA: hypothetical protein VIM53_04190 [Candidatus Saccharimonadales bacterium]